MDARSLISRHLISACLLLASAACATRPVPPAPWTPGLYDFVATLEGEGKISGQIEVTAEGPMSVATDRGDCQTPLSPVWHPWMRTRSFNCTGHYVTVNIGTRVGPAINGSVGTTRKQTVTELVRVNPPRCESYDEEGGCVAWAQEERTVVKDVRVSAPIRLGTVWVEVPGEVTDPPRR